MSIESIKPGRMSIPLIEPGQPISSSKYLKPVARELNKITYDPLRTKVHDYWTVKNPYETKIETFSIFTVNGYDVFEGFVFVDHSFTLTEFSTNTNTEIFLTNGSVEIPANTGGSAHYIDYFRPQVFRYDTGDTTPVAGKRLGPKKDSSKVSTLGCGFIALSEPDTDLELIWVMRIPYKPLLGKTQANVTSGTTVTVDEYDDTLMDNGLDIAEVTNNTGQQIDSGSFVWVFELFGHFNKQMFPAQLDDCP